MTHGGNIYAASQRTGIPVEQIVDFSASINPSRDSETAGRADKGNTARLMHYPEPTRKGSAAVSRPGTASSEVRSSAETAARSLIYLVPRALRPSRVLISAPSFGEYERACGNAGAEVVRCVLDLESDFEFDTMRL